MKTIKNLALVAFVSISAANYSTAQINDDQDDDMPRFGLKAGMNYSNVYDERGEDFVADGRVGYAVGAFVTIPLGTVFAIQPELMLSQRGFKATGSFLGTPYEMNRVTTHLDVPILFAFRPIPLISILAGPQYSYLLKRKDSFTGGFIDATVENEFENDNIRKNTLSFLGGIDINLGSVVVGARVGFDLHENTGDGTSSTPRYKNTWVQGTVGFRI